MVSRDARWYFPRTRIMAIFVCKPIGSSSGEGVISQKKERGAYG